MDKGEVEGEDIPIPPYVCCVLTEGIWTIFLAGMLITTQKEKRFYTIDYIFEFYQSCAK